MNNPLTFLTSAFLLLATAGFAQDRWDSGRKFNRDSTVTASAYIYTLSISGQYDPDKKPEGKDEQQEDNMQQLRSLKIAFFTDAMKLTGEEAQKFWPIYNEYTEKKEKISQERRIASYKMRESGNDLSDKDATTTVYNFVNSSKLDAELQMQYFEKFKAILPPAKLLQLYKAEEEFKGYLINIIRHGGNGRRNQ